MRVVAVAAPLAIGLTYPLRLTGQAAPQTAAPLQFEVASVRIAPQQRFLETRPNRTFGRFRWTTEMAYLLNYAYHMENWRISSNGVPLSTIYEVDATTDPKATEDQVRLMLQSLLIERFQTKVHRETKEVEGYALSVATGGPRMPEAKEGEVPPLPEWLRRPNSDPARMERLVIATLPEKGTGGIAGRRVTMLELTETLQRLLSTAVFDETGLSGEYYFAFRYATGNDPEVPYQDLFGAVKPLGLRLEKHKGSVEVLVVDHIEKTPAEN